MTTLIVTKERAMRQKWVKANDVLKRGPLAVSLLISLCWLTPSLAAASTSNDLDRAVEQMMSEAKEELIRSPMTLSLEHAGFHWRVKGPRSGRYWTVVSTSNETKDFIASLEPDRSYKCRALAVFTKEEVRLVSVDSCKGILRNDSLRR